MNNYDEFIKKFLTLKSRQRSLIQTKIGEIGLHFGQPPVMEYIVGHAGCTQTEIADRLGLTPASIAISTKRLEKAGMLTKLTDKDNLRCKKLTATPKGIKITKKCKQVINEVNAQTLQGFSEEEYWQLNKYFDRMLANISHEGNDRT